MAYCYMDTSALVKLMVDEERSEQLRSWISANRPSLVASLLVRTELARAVRRRAPELMKEIRGILDRLILIAPTQASFDTAGRLGPVELRSLDALHLATALELGDDLDAFVCYDQGLTAAAELLGLSVLAP